MPAPNPQNDLSNQRWQDDLLKHGFAAPTRFVLDEARWEEFVVLLHRPAKTHEGLRRLFTARSAFDLPNGATARDEPE